MSLGLSFWCRYYTCRGCCLDCDCSGWWCDGNQHNGAGGCHHDGGGEKVVVAGSGCGHGVVVVVIKVVTMMVHDSCRNDGV